MPTTLPAAAEQDLRADGFRPGAPLQLTPESYAADLAVCRSLRCGKCRRRGLTFQPFHRGERYRALAVCTTCNHATEV